MQSSTLVMLYVLFFFFFFFHEKIKYIDLITMAGIQHVYWFLEHSKNSLTSVASFKVKMNQV